MILRLFYRLLYSGLLNFLPDKLLISIQFRLLLCRRMNWDAPKTYNEKLNWLKLNDNSENYSKYVDKYAVRSYIEETIGAEYLVPLLGVWPSFDEIDWNSLPDSFVLKCNHGSHCSIICTDKKSLDLSGARSRFNSWMKRNWYWLYREKPYKAIVPCIIAEKFIGVDEVVPEDYKVFCYDGVPKLIRVDVGRYSDNVTYNYYDVDWKRSDLQFTKISDEPTPRPECLEEMLRLSGVLANAFRHVRVDWYVVGGKLYFGEMTFYNAAGYDPDFIRYEDDLQFGRYLNLFE